MQNGTHESNLEQHWKEIFWQNHNKVTSNLRKSKWYWMDKSSKNSGKRVERLGARREIMEYRLQMKSSAEN